MFNPNPAFLSVQELKSGGGAGGGGGGLRFSVSLKTVASRHKFGSPSKNKLFSVSLGDFFWKKEFETDYLVHSPFQHMSVKYLINCEKFIQTNGLFPNIQYNPSQYFLD
jgi:hypothetical protein